MKFVRDLVIFAVVFFGSYTLITYLMNNGISNQQLYNAICYTVGATLGYGLITYFQAKKKKENK